MSLCPSRLLEDTGVDWEKADIESEAMTIYLSMSPQEREEVLQNTADQINTVLGIIAIIDPSAAVAASIASQVLDQIVAQGPTLNSLPGTSRPSICERTLGPG